ncbi:hypothetical protein [Streptomyces scopuliridis]|uniref:hypothetical protein n=1 Tax=Streptomyces scopuliridis TaxID=452529 RepID=UPI002DDC5768|nr:hypothetical protein [Streptomyces scopuliridis]
MEWVSRREDFCVCGPSGRGKSHFAEVLRRTAVEAGPTVAWFTMEDPGALGPPPLLERLRRSSSRADRPRPSTDSSITPTSPSFGVFCSGLPRSPPERQ